MSLITAPITAHATNRKGPWPITCIDNGRWIIDSDHNLYDSETDTRYMRDKSIPLEELAYVDIPDLNTAANPLSLVYLFALAVKPHSSITKTILTDIANGIKVRITGTKFVSDPQQVYWVWPQTGVKHAFHTAFSHVPYMTNYLISEDGRIVDLKKNKILTVGDVCGGLIKVTAENGATPEFELARLALLAYGRFTIEELMDPILYKDGNKENFALTNLSLTENQVSTNTIKVTTADVGHRTN